MSLAVLCTCHGTVESVSDMPGFLSNIRRGRPVPPELLAEVTRRFELIGGSPLMRTTYAQAAALEARLGARVACAGRLWHPYPKDVLARLYDEGVRRVVSLPLAPQSVHVYHAAVREAARSYSDMEIVEVPCWGHEPRLIDAFEQALDEALASLPEDVRMSTPVVLSAHSLPKRVLDMGDPYERDFRSMAEIFAARLRTKGHEVRIAFQSQGATNDVWLGPDLPETFRSLKEGGAKNVAVAPIGFLADHVETLYDLDIEAKAIAEGLGFGFVRSQAPNVRDAFIDALESVARSAIEKAG